MPDDGEGHDDREDDRPTADLMRSCLRGDVTAYAASSRAATSSLVSVSTATFGAQ